MFREMCRKRPSLFVPEMTFGPLSGKKASQLVKSASIRTNLNNLKTIKCAPPGDFTV